MAAGETTFSRAIGTLKNKWRLARATFDASGLTAARALTLPDAAGTIALTSDLVPSGSILMWGGSSAPTGWLLLDGTLRSRSTYAALFSLLGTTYGVGDGSTTFGLPDMRGRAPLGVGTGASLTARTLASTGGTESHVLTTAQMPAHAHAHGWPQGTTGTYGTIDSNTASSSGTANTGSQGGGTSHPIMQPWIALNFIIKA